MATVGAYEAKRHVPGDPSASTSTDEVVDPLLESSRGRTIGAGLSIRDRIHKGRGPAGGRNEGPPRDDAEASA